MQFCRPPLLQTGMTVSHTEVFRNLLSEGLLMGVPRGQVTNVSRGSIQTILHRQRRQRHSGSILGQSQKQEKNVHEDSRK